jgi:hypothetical protein
MTINQKLIDGVKRTGFILEYNVSRQLEKYNWNVINNRYYLDDVKNVDREIDIIAYKVKEIENCFYYTTLIISCKKSDIYLWAFLTADLRDEDPNIDICPISNWTNNKILKYMLDNVVNAGGEIQKQIDKEYLNFVYGINKRVFAFQQMSVKEYKPQNDDKIYDSIISTIKALEYEKNSLDVRKSDTSFYDFHLLSVFDGEMNEVYFKDDEIFTYDINNIKYLNRHIINKKENFYRVHFINSNKLEEYIPYFNSLHSWNSSFYSQLNKDYFNNITKYPKSYDVFKKEFFASVKNRIIVNTGIICKEIDIEYDSSRKIVRIMITFKNISDEDTFFDNYNNDTSLKKVFEQSLDSIYKYKGDFIVQSDLPF